MDKATRYKKYKKIERVKWWDGQGSNNRID